MSVTPQESVTAMLAAAGLTIPEDEKAEFVAAYPAFRASLERILKTDTGRLS